MRECIYLGQQIGKTQACCNGGGMEVHQCTHPAREKDYCVTHPFNGSFADVDLADGRVQRYGLEKCPTCPLRTISALLPPKPPGNEEIVSPTIQRWREIHYESRTPPDSGNAAVVLDCDSPGYGDAVVAAWLAEGMKGQRVSIALYASGAKRTFLETICGQHVLESKPSLCTVANIPSTDRLNQSYPSRLESWSRSVGFAPRFARPKPNISRDILSWATSVTQPGTIAMCPHSTHGCREWPFEYWRELHELVARSGRNVVWLGNTDNRYKGMPQSQFGISWPQSAAIMMQCDAVVGLDSAPVHVAGTLDRPAIAILGPTGDAVFAHMPSVRCISAERRLVKCVGCWFGHPHAELCNDNCAAMSNVLPEQVFELLEKILHETRTT